MKDVMLGLTTVLVPIAVCVALPVLIVWLTQRGKAHETNKRTEIVLAAINANKEIDIEEFLKKLEAPKPSIKESLLKKLNSGLICLAIGAGLTGFGLYLDYNGGSSDLEFFYLGGVLMSLIGIAILITYFCSKRMLVKELEAEGNAALEEEAAKTLEAEPKKEEEA